MEEVQSERRKWQIHSWMQYLGRQNIHAREAGCFPVSRPCFSPFFFCGSPKDGSELQSCVSVCRSIRQPTERCSVHSVHKERLKPEG